ncbi:MAG: hypothetical protein PUD15_00355 [Prevotella sp.]|uniref:hypothetical protein n=1 Tax=Prevotella sp. AGR2160 TaxID=1280674 RepID=UPI0018CA74B1|nr:hypothetical protein [Prevotella sp. AGR2160]MDD5861003.1 hypothetical protein [Prevotella sp.]
METGFSFLYMSITPTLRYTGDEKGKDSQRKPGNGMNVTDKLVSHENPCHAGYSDTKQRH